MMTCSPLGVLVLVLATAVCDALPAVCDGTTALSAPWAHAGPGGYRQGATPGKFDEGIASAGAAQAMVQLGGANSTEWLLATANGGIWRTTDLLAAKGPNWVQVLDGQPVTCTSISAMERRGSTVLAGCGSATSSEMGFDWMAFNSGDWGGLLLSHDNGHTWSMTAFPPNMFITAIVLLSNESFLVSVRASFHDRDAGGVWRTTDAGATWTRTLDKPVYDLVAVPCVCRSLRPTAPLHPSSFHIPPRPASAPSLTQGIRSLA